MDSWVVCVNAVSSDGEKLNAEYVVEATSMTGAFYMFEQSPEEAKLRQFIKDGYYKMHCRRKYTYTYTKGTEPPAGNSSS